MKKIAILLVAAMLLAGIGITPVLAQTQSAVRTYIVQPGDNLTKIAREFGVTLTALIAANPQIANPNLIFPGEVINIPSGGTVGGGTGGGGVLPVTGGSIYLVKPGDNLSRIATRFGVTLGSLEAVNPQVTNPNLIFPGMNLTLPAGAQPVPTLSITPTTGLFGTTVTLDATGFSANSAVIVSFGPVGGTFVQLDKTMTDAHGALYGKFTVPNLTSIIPMSGQYEFSVALASNTSISAVSNPISISGAGGTAGSIYIVKAGDNLTRIAAAFGTTVSAIMAANPSIGSNFIIFPGESLVIPGSSGSVAPSGAFVYVAPLSARPGDVITVYAGNFPANAKVDVRIAKQGQAVTTTVNAQANAQGIVSAQITVPSTVVAGEQWVVSVTTTELATAVQATARSITIS